MSFPVSTVKPVLFVSYHHGDDQYYYNKLSTIISSGFGFKSDNSLDKEIESKSVDYVMRVIREDYITGSSCTIVLCGPNTPYRKYIDWEIDATLYKQHALVGLRLPTLQLASNGGTDKPARLQDNLDSGYAVWGQFSDVMTDSRHLSELVYSARSRSKSLIRNARPSKLING